MTPAQHNEILQEFENLVAKIERMASNNAKSDYGTFIKDSEKEIEQLKAKVDDLTKENRYLQRQLEVQRLENRRIKERIAIKGKEKRDALERAAKNFSIKEQPPQQPQMPHWISGQKIEAKDKTAPGRRIYVINDPGEKWGWADERAMKELLDLLGLNFKDDKGDE